MTTLRKEQLEISNGWNVVTNVIPTLTSTTNGVDTISFAGVDLTGLVQEGEWVKANSTAGSFLKYKVVSVSFSTNTTMTIVGETSVTGTITKIEFSKMATPQGCKPWEAQFLMSAEGNNDYVTNATDERINYGEEIDVNGNYASSNRYTVPVTGYYRIYASVRYGSDVVANKIYKVSIKKNGSGSVRTQTTQSGGGGYQVGCSVGVVAKLNRGDYLEVWTYHNSGSGAYSEGGSFEINFLGI